MSVNSTTAIAVSISPEQFIFAQGESLITTSIKVAEAFGKLHKNVIQKIETLECSAEFSGLNFKPADYVDEQGKPRKMYEMTKDGFMFLVMGFTGKAAAAIKEAYINAFNLMAAQLFGKQALPEPPTITKEQEGLLYNKVVELSLGDGKLRHEIWREFNAEFNLNTYKNLPHSRFDSAMAFLESRREEYTKGIKKLIISEAELNELVEKRAKAMQGELLTKGQSESKELTLQDIDDLLLRRLSQTSSSEPEKPVNLSTVIPMRLRYHVELKQIERALNAYGLRIAVAKKNDDQFELHEMQTLGGSVLGK